ncbi:M20/M25/M40 family metallo-hydrolase [Duganella callida]|nr:M20/M25/M40 family metallo-hydrolase [Duganella callida]
MATQTTLSPKVNWALGSCAILVLLLLAVLGLSAARLPAPQPASAPSDAFSAARAMDHLRQIAHEPHAVGTAANARVRAYLIERLQALGLQPEVQTGMGRMNNRPWGAVGIVNNIVVRVPGASSAAGGPPRKALLLAAHYDSVPTGPGAADDGASVAAILETLRALQTGARLQNDLIVLFTDGEEAGLLGSDLFVKSHPWAKEAGLVLNFEYRGNSGPMLMFETSPGNGKLVTALAQSLPQQVASSMLYELYKVMPNDTDMSSFKRIGVPGLNFAAIEKPVSYHLQTDSIDNLNQATLQQQGEIMLTLTRQFGNRPLEDLSATDRVYFDLPGIGLVHYTTTAVIPLMLVTAAALCAVAVLGIKGGMLRPLRVLLAMPLFLLMAVLLGVGCQLIWGGVSLLHPEYGVLGDPYNSQWYLLAFVALVIGAYIAMKAGVARWLRPMELGFGALVLWLLLLLITSFAMPGVTFMFGWPLLAMLGVLAVLFSRRGSAVTAGTRTALLVLGLAPAVILFAPVVRNLYIGLSPQMSVVTGLVLALVAGLMTPLLTVLTRRFLLPAVPLAAGAVFLIAGSMTAQIDAAHPNTSNLFYAWDSASGKAFWISRDQQLGGWSKHYFPTVSDKQQVPEVFGVNSRKYWVSPAPRMPGLEAPQIAVLSDTSKDGVREVRFKVRTLRQAPVFSVKVEGAEVLASRVDGQPFTQKPNPLWLLEAYGMEQRELEVALQVKAGKPFNIRVNDETYGLPHNGITVMPRPAGLIQSIYGTNGDTVRAVRVKSFS